MISKATQVVLLMTARFPGGGGEGKAKPLSLTEWNRFAKWLKSKELTPEQLLAGAAADLIGDWWDKSITGERLESLLERGVALALFLEKWERSGLWVVTRSDPDYPESLKNRLKGHSPVLFFGCGDRSLLNAGGLAVVGSRNADAKNISYSALLGAGAAESGFCVISGGARGVDEAAMFGSLLNGGTAVGVLADGLMNACLSEKYREYLLGRKLALISPYNPEAGFHGGNAMRRNKYIYCLSNAAVVVHSHHEKGGTLNGALENLEKRWVKLWVRRGGAATGNARLAERGASWLPKQIGEIDFSDLFAEDTRNAETVSYETFVEKLRVLSDSQPLGFRELTEAVQVDRKQLNCWLKRAVSENRIEKLDRPVRYLRVNPEVASYEAFLEKIETLCGIEPRPPGELMEAVGISKRRLTPWLKRAVSENKMEKLDRPVRYRWNDRKTQGELYPR